MDATNTSGRTGSSKHSQSVIDNTPSMVMVDQQEDIDRKADELKKIYQSTADNQKYKMNAPLSPSDPNKHMTQSVGTALAHPYLVSNADHNAMRENDSDESSDFEEEIHREFECFPDPDDVNVRRGMPDIKISNASMSQSVSMNDE